jgi:acyl-CoA dehydrogenase
VSEELDIIAATVGRLLTDLADPQAIALNPDGDWRQRLWQALEDAGIPQAWAPEAAGGAGLGAVAVGRIARLAGGHAVAVPLIETMLANRWAGLAGLDLVSGMMAFAPTRPGETISIDGNNRLNGVASEIPLADDSARAIILAEGPSGRLAVARLDLADHIEASRHDYAGDRRVRVRFDGAQPQALGWLSHGRPFDGVMAGAALRACQMAGALAAVLEHTVEYAGDRTAFGRPIAKFQAIQHHLATFAGETAAASVVADDAMAGLGQDDEREFFTTACAKVRAGEAAYEGARIAHQVFGAIGYTNEHLLHRYTQRLWAWRDDFGTESDWATLLGRTIAAAGPDAHWPALTAGAVAAP